jgi:hypothetical protein
LYFLDTAPLLSHIHRFNVTPNTLSLSTSSLLSVSCELVLYLALTQTKRITVFQPPSADYSQPHSDNFSNSLRRIGLYLPLYAVGVGTYIPVPLSCSCSTSDVPQRLGHCCTIDSQVAVQVQNNAQREAEPSNLK